MGNTSSQGLIKLDLSLNKLKLAMSRWDETEKMLDINRVLKEDRLLRAFTGLNRKAFDELSIAFEILLNCEVSAKSQTPRKRSVGGGRKARLQRVEEKLLDLSLNKTEKMMK